MPFKEQLFPLYIDEITSTKTSTLVISDNIGKKELPQEVVVGNKEALHFTKLIVIPNKDGNSFVSGNSKGMLQIWEHKDNNLSCIVTFKNCKSPVIAVAAMAYGAVVAAHANGKVIAYIPVGEGKYASEVVSNNCGVVDLIIYFSKQDKQFITIAIDKEHKLMAWRRKGIFGSYNWQVDGKLFSEGQKADEIALLENVEGESIFLVNNNKMGEKIKTIECCVNKSKTQLTLEITSPIKKIVPYSSKLIFVATRDGNITGWQRDSIKNNAINKVLFVQQDKRVVFLGVIASNFFIAVDSDNTIKVWKNGKCVQITKHPLTIVGMVVLSKGPIVFVDSKQHYFYFLTADAAFDVRPKEHQEQLCQALCSNNFATSLELKALPVEIIHNKYFLQLLVENQKIATYALQHLQIDNLGNANKFFRELLLSAKKNFVATSFFLPQGIDENIIHQFAFLCSVNQKSSIYNFQDAHLLTPDSIKFALKLLCERSKDDFKIDKLNLNGLTFNQEHIALLSKLLLSNQSLSSLKLEKITLNLKMQNIVLEKWVRKLIKQLILQSLLTEIKISFTSEIIEKKLEQMLNSKAAFLVAANKQQSSLSLKYFNLTDSSAIKFALKLVRKRYKTSKLINLDLSDLALSYKHIEYLASIFKHNNSLTSLSLNNVTFSEKRAKRLVQAIKESKIKELNITGTNLSAANAKELALLMEQRSGKIVGDEANLRRLSPLEKAKIVPVLYRCPLSGKIMLDPLVTPPPDGKTYELEALLAVLLNQYPCPATQKENIENLRKVLGVNLPSTISIQELKEQLCNKNKVLYPNLTLKELINGFLKERPVLYDSDELYTPLNDIEEIKKAVVNDKKNNTATQLEKLIEDDARRLTKALQDGKPLLFNVCRYGNVQLVKLVLTKLVDKFWHIGDVANNNGKELFFWATLNEDSDVGAACAKIIAEKLHWGKKEYQEELLYAQKKGDINLATLCLMWLIDESQCSSNTILLFAQKHLTDSEFLVKFLQAKLSPENSKNFFVWLTATKSNGENDQENTANAISKGGDTAAFSLLITAFKSLSKNELEKVVLTPYDKCNLLCVATQYQLYGGMLELVKQLPDEILNLALMDEVQQVKSAPHLLELMIKYQNDTTLKEFLNRVTPEALRQACSNSVAKFNQLNEVLFKREIGESEQQNVVKLMRQENIKLLRDKFFFQENVQQLNDKIEKALTVLTTGKFDMVWNKLCEEAEQSYVNVSPYFVSAVNSVDEKLVNEVRKKFRQLTLLIKLYRPKAEKIFLANNELTLLEAAFKKLFSSAKKLTLEYPLQQSSQESGFLYIAAQITEKLLSEALGEKQKDSYLIEEIDFINFTLEPTLLKKFLAALLQQQKLSLVFNHSFSSSIDFSKLENIKSLDLSNNIIDANLKTPLYIERLILNKISLQKIDCLTLFRLIRKNSPSLREFVFCDNELSSISFGMGNPFDELLHYNQALQKIKLNNSLTVQQIEKLIDALADNLDVTQCDADLDSNNFKHQRVSIILKRNCQDKKKWQEKEQFLRIAQGGLLSTLANKKFEFSMNSTVSINDKPQFIAQEVEESYARIKREMQELQKVYYPQAIMKELMHENEKIVTALLDFWLTINWSDKDNQELTLTKQIDVVYEKNLILYNELIKDLRKNNSSKLDTIIPKITEKNSEKCPDNFFSAPNQSDFIGAIQSNKKMIAEIDIHKKYFTELLKTSDFDLNKILNQENSVNFLSVIKNEDVYVLYFDNVCKFLSENNDSVQLNKCLMQTNTALQEITKTPQLINNILSKSINVTNVVLQHKSLTNKEKYEYIVQFMQISCKQLPETLDNNLRASMGEICEICINNKIEELKKSDGSKKEQLYAQLYQDIVKSELYLRAPTEQQNNLLEKIYAAYIGLIKEKIDATASCQKALNWCEKLFENVIQFKIMECGEVKAKVLSDKYTQLLLSIVDKYLASNKFLNIKTDLTLLGVYQEQCKQLFALMRKCLPVNYKEEHLDDEVMKRLFQLATGYLQKSLLCIKKTFIKIIFFKQANSFTTIEIKLNEVINRQKNANNSVFNNENFSGKIEEKNFPLTELISVFSKELGEFSKKYPNTEIVSQLDNIKHFFDDISLFLSSFVSEKSIIKLDKNKNIHPIEVVKEKMEGEKKVSINGDGKNNNINEGKNGEDKILFSSSNRELISAINGLTSCPSSEDVSKLKPQKELNIDSLLKLQEEREQREEEERKYLEEEAKRRDEEEEFIKIKQLQQQEEDESKEKIFANENGFDGNKGDERIVSLNQQLENKIIDSIFKQDDGNKFFPDETKSSTSHSLKLQALNKKPKEMQSQDLPPSPCDNNKVDTNQVSFDDLLKINNLF